MPLSDVAMTLLGRIGIDSTAPTQAQDAALLAGDLSFVIAPGATADILAPLEHPPSLYGARFAPRVTFALATAPAIILIYLEVGTLVARLVAPVTVVRAGARDAAGEVIAAVREEVTLSAGDFTTIPTSVGGDIRNESQHPAQVAVAELIPEKFATSVAATPVS